VTSRPIARYSQEPFREFFENKPVGHNDESPYRSLFSTIATQRDVTLGLYGYVVVMAPRDAQLLPDTNSFSSFH